MYKKRIDVFNKYTIVEKNYVPDPALHEDVFVADPDSGFVEVDKSVLFSDADVVCHHINFRYMKTIDLKENYALADMIYIYNLDLHDTYRLKVAKNIIDKLTENTKFIKICCVAHIENDYSLEKFDIILPNHIIQCELSIEIYEKLTLKKGITAKEKFDGYFDSFLDNLPICLESICMGDIEPKIKNPPPSLKVIIACFYKIVCKEVLELINFSPSLKLVYCKYSFL